MDNAKAFDRSTDIEALKSKSPEITRKIVQNYVDNLKRISGKKYSELDSNQKALVDNAREFAKWLKELSVEAQSISTLSDIYNTQAEELNQLLKQNTLMQAIVIDDSTIARVDLTQEVPKTTWVEKPTNLLVSEIITKLSDLNLDWDIDDKNIIDEKNLKILINRVAWIWKWEDRVSAIQKLANVFKNVTWEEATDFWQSDIQKFQSKLLFNLNFLNSIWIWTWAISLLRWKMLDFVQNTDLTKLKPREIDKATYDKLSPTIQNVLGWLLTAWVLRLSGGFVMVWHEATTFESEDFIKKLESQKNSPILSKGWEILTWIKEAFMWRKLSISFWQDKMTIAEMEESVLKHTTEVMSLKLDGKDDKNSITDKNLKENYDYAVSLIWKDPSKKEALKLAMQKSLIQSYILNLWEENKWSDYRFTLWLLFIWWHRDNVEVDYVWAKVDPELLKRDALPTEEVSSKNLEEMWVKIERNNDWKYNHVIPSTLKLVWDDKSYPVEIVSPEWVDVRNSDKLYDFHFTLLLWGNDKYVVTFTPRIWNVNSLTPIWDRWTQNISQVRNAREWSEVISNKTLDQVLYDIVWHQVAFWKLAKSVSKWDLEWTKSEILSLEKKFKNNKQVLSYLKLLKNNLNSFIIWDTYMSWNKETRAKKSPQYGEVRSDAVIRAENALAKSTWFPIPWFEWDFEVKSDYKSKQISEIISWQELTSVQFMTPVDRSNIKESRQSLHRVSIQDGSFAVSEKTTFISDLWRKKQIVEWIINSSHESRWIKTQLKKLNEFLFANHKNIVTLEQYKNYLISWDLKDLWVEWLQLQPGKETKFLEARAMIAGNICLNLTYAIWYPAFQLENSKQEITAVATSDLQATLNLPIVSWDRQALWGSVLWIISEIVNKNPKHNSGKIQTRPWVEPRGWAWTWGWRWTPIVEVSGR